MPRVRIGLTGLACVFLLVLIAAALFGNQRSVRHISPEEPLAELGVAPGGAPPIKSNLPAKPVLHEPLAEFSVAPGGGRPAAVTSQLPHAPITAAAGAVRPASPPAH
jgi:hypothetical protein